MTVSTQRSATLSGAQLIEVFLKELAQFVRSNPDKEFDGTPREIVEEVIARSFRFGGCTEKSIDDLSRQMAMAIRSKGGRYGLGYEILSKSEGRIRVMMS